MSNTGYAPISERRFVLFDTPLSEHAAAVFRDDHPVVYLLTSTTSGQFVILTILAVLTTMTILSISYAENKRDYLWSLGFALLLVVVGSSSYIGKTTLDPTDDIYNRALDNTAETVQRDLAEWLAEEDLDVNALCASPSRAVGYGRDAGSYFDMEETIMCGGHVSATALYPLELENDPAYQVTVFIDDMGIRGKVRRDSLAGTV